MNTSYFLLLWLDAFLRMSAPCPRCGERAATHKMLSPLNVDTQSVSAQGDDLGVRMTTTFTCGERLTVMIDDTFSQLLVGA